jgi:hypothetical protein
MYCLYTFKLCLGSSVLWLNREDTYNGWGVVSITKGIESYPRCCISLCKKATKKSHSSKMRILDMSPMINQRYALFISFSNVFAPLAVHKHVTYVGISEMRPIRHVSNNRPIYHWKCVLWRRVSNVPYHHRRGWAEHVSDDRGDHWRGGFLDRISN